MDVESEELVPISVNWHVWPLCNYRCRFCFTTFKHLKNALPRNEAIRVPGILAEAGTEKLTFAGGEPTICPFLAELLEESKRHGLTTMVISNGTGLTERFLSRCHEYLDWVALSVDSSIPAIEVLLGRGSGSHLDNVMAVWERLEEYGIRRKLNTVVTSLTWQEDMSSVLVRLKPERWKVLQVLPIRGENERDIAELTVSSDQFQSFVDRHAEFDPVPESNESMTSSYLMLDPVGRFFQNTTGRYAFSASLFRVGVRAAIREVGWDSERFNVRGGSYDWRRPYVGEGA